MPLEIIAPITMPFTARACTSVPSSGRFAGAISFGTGMLDIINTGTRAATSVLVTNVDPSGEIALYGPTSHVSVPAGGRIPIGVAFFRKSGGRTTPTASSVVTVSWREGPSRRTPPTTATITVTFTVAGRTVTGQDTIFVPSEVELIAGSTSKSMRIGLLCQQAVTTFRGSAFPPGSAFSKITPTPDPPARFFALGEMPELILDFDSDMAKDGKPQFVTVTVGAPPNDASTIVGSQSVPLICWVANTVRQGELSIAFTADPPGADLETEFVTITNVSPRGLDVGGCSLNDRDRTGSAFTFPADFFLSVGSSVDVYSGRGPNSSTRPKLFWGRTEPVWNNDSDTAVLLNFLGEEIARSDVTRTAGRTNFFTGAISVPKSARSTPTGITLEDGDIVLFFPDMNSSIWTGNLLSGTCSPAGISRLAPANAPDEAPWPFPGVPMFALLADAGLGPVLIGGSTVTVLVDRNSVLKSGRPLNLFINDQNPGAADSWGSYSCLVTVLRT